MFSFNVLFRGVECFFRRNVLSQQYIVKKINALYLMKIDLRKKAQHRALRLFRTWEELETAIIKEVVKENMKVLDLGANIGYYSLLFAELTGEQGRVYVVEPLPRNLTQLKENILLNGFQRRISMENIAISDKTGTMDFFLGKTDNVGTLFGAVSDNQTGESIKVKTVSLVDYLKDKPRIDFIRMDIERGELKVFKDLMEHGRELRQGLPKRIFFEIHPIGKIDPDPAYTPCLNWLFSAGYYAEYVVASSNPLAAKKFKSLGYTPEKLTSEGQALFCNIKSEHLIEIAARRPKITRAILLKLYEVL